MKHDVDMGPVMPGHVAHCPDTAVQEFAQLRPAGTAAVGQEKTGVDFVADLHHVGEQVFFREAVQHLVGIGVDGIPHYVRGQPCPGGGRRLLAGIGPVVGIMEVQQSLHAGVFGAAHGALRIEKRAVLVGRRVPQADAYEVGAPVGKKGERIHHLPAFAVDPAALFHLVDVGEIGAQHHRIAGGIPVAAAVLGAAAQGVRETIRSNPVSGLPEMVVPALVEIAVPALVEIAVSALVEIAVPALVAAVLPIRRHQGAHRKQDAQCRKNPTFSGERRHSERGHSDLWISESGVEEAPPETRNADDTEGCLSATCPHHPRPVHICAMCALLSYLSRIMRRVNT